MSCNCYFLLYLGNMRKSTLCEPFLDVEGNFYYKKNISKTLWKSKNYCIFVTKYDKL